MKPPTKISAKLIRVAATGVAILLYSTPGVSADGQFEMRANASMQRDLRPGVSDSYTIRLTQGTYVAGSIQQHGAPINAALFLPDGSHDRNFSSSLEGRIQFAFIAAQPGIYRLVLTSPLRAGKYELVVAEVLSFNERLNRLRRGQEPTPRPEMYSAAAIDALRQQIFRGNTNTEAFWKEVSREGTPLVESLGSGDQYQLVTFLWRGSPETRNVLVSGSFAKPTRRDYLMNELGSTDVWYLTVKVPRGARFMYGLSTVSDVSDLELISSGASGMKDPFNPHSWMGQSMAELPGAPAQAWIEMHAGTPEGHLESQKFESIRLKNERGISVYTPAGYKATGAPCALVLIFDESAYLRQVPVPLILDNLIAASRIPAMVAVLVGNINQETRSNELEPNERFADFLAYELIPWIRARYNVTHEARETVIAGSSLGGIAATYAAFRHSEVFGNVLSQSGSFWWSPNHEPRAIIDATTETGWLAKEFARSPKLPLTFYLDAGVFEADYSGTGGSILETTRHMRDVLIAKGYAVHYQQFVGGHDYPLRANISETFLAAQIREQGEKEMNHDRWSEGCAGIRLAGS